MQLAIQGILYLSLFEEKDPQSFLEHLRIKNINLLIIGQLNINSLRNKFEQLSTMISGNIDILMMSETKLGETFPAAQCFVTAFLNALQIWW